MCCVFIGRNKPATLEIVEGMGRTNRDGFGVGWFNGGKAIYKKGINSAQEVFDLIQNIPLPYVIHARIKSVGVVNPLLTHPYEITEKSELKLEGSCDKILLHNGSFYDHRIARFAAGFDDYEKDELYSDTRSIAQVISKNNEKFLTKICTNSKFVVMDGTNNEIRTYGEFKVFEDWEFSNLLWRCSIGQFKKKEFRNPYDDDDYSAYFNEGATHISNISRREKRQMKRDTRRYESYWENQKIKNGRTLCEQMCLDTSKMGENTQRILGLQKISYDREFCI